MITLQFVMGRGPVSRAIALFSAGLLSHVDAVLPDGRLLGARSDRLDGIPPGARIRPPKYETWEATTCRPLDAPAEKQSAFWDFLFGEVGKPYDHTAIWGFAVGRNWRAPDSWFCSELISAALEQPPVSTSLLPRLQDHARGLSRGALGVGRQTRMKEIYESY